VLNEEKATRFRPAAKKFAARVVFSQVNHLTAEKNGISKTWSQRSDAI
jgi:hypothetical protein